MPLRCPFCNRRAMPGCCLRSCPPSKWPTSPRDERPTIPGRYWYCCENGAWEIVLIFPYKEYGDTLHVAWIGSEHVAPLANAIGDWIGPLKEPPPVLAVEDMTDEQVSAFLAEAGIGPEQLSEGLRKAMRLADEAQASISVPRE
jgi:hypothetical protein